MYDNEFVKQLRSIYGFDYAKASKDLGVSERQVKRYIQTGKPTQTIKNLVGIIYRGYLPVDGPWKYCKIRPDNMMETPYGMAKPSDVMLVHRYKWSAKQHRDKYNQLKNDTSTKTQDMLDIQDQLLQIIGDIAKKTGS
ncbi:hypothetical protein [Pseudoalteromonas ruthenica]|uniref:hypothetical protein n=1 Tax=Pseudoalteromonas ruthenica TaxID=151081 RepID=UPI0012467A5C|nr:hypothetical protein [Pseudoalteromonas ruthenica]|tara:strand:+ start:114 stop:527 length:414 start_codon:yes stop_codon:yes gene_type:complete